MSQEDKDLLLKDLCARLPYNVKCLYRNVDDEIKIGKLNIIEYDEERIVIDTTSLDHKGSDVVGVFPFLFPLSSMSEEQYEKFIIISGWDGDIEDIRRGKFLCLGTIGIDYIYDTIDWLNKNHFDYRGLIDKGLAINATNLNIY